MPVRSFSRTAIFGQILQNRSTGFQSLMKLDKKPFIFASHSYRSAEVAKILSQIYQKALSCFQIINVNSGKGLNLVSRSPKNVI